MNWTDVAVHACQILNTRKKVLFVTATELGNARDTIDHAVQDGYDVIAVPGTVRAALVGLKDLKGNRVVDLSVYQAEWSHSFKFKFVSREAQQASSLHRPSQHLLLIILLDRHVSVLPEPST